MADARLSSDHRRHQVHTESRVGVEVVVTRIVYWAFGVIEALLAVRFLLRLLGANPEAAFTAFIYRLTEALLSPFEAVFPTQNVEGAVFEWTTLLAIVVYALVAWAITALVAAVSPRAAVTTVEETQVAEDTHEAEDTRTEDTRTDQHL